MFNCKLRKQIKILKESGLDKYMSKKQLKIVAKLALLNCDVLVVNNMPL
jgi:hypothetical protein